MTDPYITILALLHFKNKMYMLLLYKIVYWMK